MTGDPAAIARSLGMERASTVDPDDAPEGVICYQREKAAVTIAAFLRALPVGLRGVPGAILDGHAPAIMPHRLAAAVASAAAEETPDE